MEAAIAIILAAGVFIAVYIDQKKKDRAEAATAAVTLSMAVSNSVGLLPLATKELEMAVRQQATATHALHEDLAPLCETVAALKPDPVDLTPLIETIAQLDLSFHQHYDDSRLRNTIRAVAFPADDLKTIAEMLAPLVESALPRLDTMERDMRHLSTRVEVGPGKRTLRVP